MQNLGESGAQPGIFNHITQSRPTVFLGLQQSTTKAPTIGDMDALDAAKHSFRVAEQSAAFQQLMHEKAGTDKGKGEEERLEAELHDCND